MIRTLIVDDHRLITRALEDNLATFGDFYVVDIVHDGAMVMESIYNNKPDLIILDVQLPSIGGDELLPIIKKTTHCKVCMLTGSNNRGLWLSLIRNGADGMMVKSISSQEMEHGLRKIIGGDKYVQHYILDSVSNFDEGVLLKIKPHYRKKLTKIERQFLVLEFACLDESVISSKMGLSVEHLFTIKKSIMAKLGLSREIDYKMFFV